MNTPPRPLLEIDLVQTFVAVAELGGFTAAAARVHRTPSAVSMQMKRLEELVSRPLFIRHPRAVALTPDGDAFLVHAREMLRVNEAALSRFRQPVLEGRIRFGAPDDFGARALPSILCRFAASHPQVEVDVVLSTSADLRARFDAEELDLTLYVACVGEASPGQLVFEEDLHWFGKKNGAAVRREPLPLALSTQSCPWRMTALNSMKESGRPYRIAYTSEIGQGQLAAVEADLAIAPFPASLLHDGLERLGSAHGLREIGRYALRLLTADGLGEAGSALRGHVLGAFQDRGAT